MKILGMFFSVIVDHEVYSVQRVFQKNSRGSGTDGRTYISDGNPNILESDRNDDGRQVNAYYDNPDNNWNDNGAFVVPVSQLSSFPR